MAFGRVEAGQAHLKESVDGLRSDLGGVVSAQNAQGVLLAQVQAQTSQNTRDIADGKRREEARRAPWTAIGAFIVAGLAFAWTIAKSILGT